MQHIDTVRPMDGHAFAPGHESHDLIPRHRIAAPWKTHRYIRDPAHQDPALGLCHMNLLVGAVIDLAQDQLLCQFLLVLLFVFLLEAVHHLALLEPAVPDCRQDRVPVPEAVFFLDHLLVLRLEHIRHIDGFHPAVGRDQILPPDNIFFLKFLLKPLIDLGFCLGALHDIEPVPAGPLGILRGQHLNAVPVLDLVINGHQLSIHPGSHHPVAHRAVDGIGKVYGCGAVGQAFHIPVGSEAVYILRKQIQIAL